MLLNFIFCSVIFINYILTLTELFYTICDLPVVD